MKKNKILMVECYSLYVISGATHKKKKKTIFVLKREKSFSIKSCVDKAANEIISLLSMILPLL